MYYGNQECEVIADIGGGEVVIELCIADIEEECGEDSCVYPYETKVIVSKRYITDVPLDKQSKVQECKDIINEANKEVGRVKSESNKQIREEKAHLEKEIELLRKKSAEYKGLHEYVNFLDGKYTYVVYLEEYRTGIRKLDEIMCRCTSANLAAVSFRSDKKAKWNKDFEGWLYVNEYSDDSGHSRYKVRGFGSLEEAEAFFGQAILDKLIKISDRVLVECDKHKITNTVIEAYRLEKISKEEVANQKKIQDLKTELAKAERV